MDDSAAAAFAQTIHDRARFIVFFWPLVTLVILPLAAAFPERVVPLDMAPPAGTSSYVAQNVFEAHFGKMMNARTETVLLNRTDSGSAVTELTAGLILELESIVQRFGVEYPGTILRTQSYYTYGTELTPNPLLSRDGAAVLFQWTWRVPIRLTLEANALVEKLLARIDEMNEFQVGANRNLFIGATGPTFLKRSVMEVVREEILGHDCALMPISAGILALRLGSLKMLIFPLCSIFMSVPLAFSLCYFYSLSTLVVSYAPTMVWLLSVALGLDYSLFMLTRYKEERRNGASVEDAVVVMIMSSGQVIVLSGTVLMVAYATMLFLPGSVKSVSFSSCAAILMTMLVQLTFLPALLTVCPSVAGMPDVEDVPSHSETTDVRFVDLRNGKESRARASFMESESVDSMVPVMALEAEHPNNPERFGYAPATAPGQGWDSPERKALQHASGCWFSLGSVLTRFPLNIIIPSICYIIFFPFTNELLHYRPAHGFVMEVPQHRQEWALSNEIGQRFVGDVGCFFPIFIIMVADEQWTSPNSTGSVDIRDQRFFEANCQMVDALIRASKGTPYELTADSFRSVTFHEPSASGQGDVACDSYAQGQWFRSSFLTRNSMSAQLSKQLMNAFVSPNHDAIITVLYPSIDAFSDAAFDLVRTTRKVLEQESQRTDHEGLVFLTHSFTGVNMDTIQIMSERLPVAFAGCAIISFCFIAASFGAIFIPVKLFFTIILPITWTYGVGICVYKYGWLAWTGLEGVTPVGDGGLMWMAPVYTLTIILGLALDYDIFLFSRVWEFRKQGFGDKESIQLGLAATGPIITTAGLIFCVTFSGLLLSTIPLTNQIGFLFAFSMLIDTFVVRTILVPAMLSMWPALNYWPSSLPVPRYVFQS